MRKILTNSPVRYAVGFPPSSTIIFALCHNLLMVNVCFHEALNTEKDRARASADVQSSQKTLAQSLPHFSALPQGNALPSIFLRPRASWFVLKLF